ncbi:MAG: D-xylose transporter XylE [Bacteroidota bacterium]
MGNKYLLKTTIIATLGGLLFGYDTAVISGTVSALKDFFIIPQGIGELEANSLLGFVVSSALIGSIIGAFSGGIISKKFGRKKGLIIAATLFLISALGSSMPELGFAPIGEGSYIHLYQFVFYRIIGGVGIGLASMLSPMYIAEIAPSDKRGALVSFNQFAIVSGILVVYFVNYSIASQGDDSWINAIGWRYMFASEAVPAIVFLVLLLLVPESPRWLILNNREEEGTDILTKINGEEKAKIILEEIKASSGHHTSLSMFSYGSLILVIGVMLAAFQQFSGINAVLYYAPEIFKSMGYGTDSALMQTIIVGVINVIFTIVAIKTVDKYGRKPLMIWGSVSMGLSMISLGLTFYFDNVGILALIFMLMFITSFALSSGPVTWVLLTELFPNKIRGKAMSLVVATTWITNYIVSWSFPVMNDSSYLTDRYNHGFAYWVYGIISIVSAVFVWKLVMETKGKSLEEIEAAWKTGQKYLFTNFYFLRSS